LWDEYRQTWPDGYGYSRFCELLRAFQKRLSPVMRQHHVAGDKLFVDYSGKRLEIRDPATGEIRVAEIFVAVLGASNYTFAEVTWSQTLPDWIGSHVRLFRHIDGVVRLIVPDNLKSGVNKASFYDPEINRSYGRMTAHYDVGVLPARPKKPRDKASVEAGVRFAQSYIIGRLRNQTFFSLDEANAAIAVVMTRMNTHPIRKLGVSRADLLESLERPALRPLPVAEYEYAEWRLVRAGIDYHVEIENFYYSVPHALIREQVDARITERTIELFHRGRRVAAHPRRYGSAPRHGTDVDHMPSAHRHYAEWSPERFCRWGADIGPDTEGLIIAILARRPHPEQGFRSCLGVLRLYKALEKNRAESISAYALAIGALNSSSVASIIAHNLDLAAPAEEGGSVDGHANVRGPRYFH
jgi:transposase